MAKHRKRTSKRRKTTRKQRTIPAEIQYIVARAARRDSRVVTLGTLLFFSSESGDAWMLDPEDSMALCLAIDGEPTSVNIYETDAAFGVQWTSTYTFEDDAFQVTDDWDRTKTIFGYPVSEIRRAIERLTLRCEG